VNNETDGGVELPNADPLSMDLYVQVSYAESAENKSESFFDGFREQFSEMPVENPDGTEGIDVHVTEGPWLDESVTFTGSNYQLIKFDHYEDNVGERADVYHNVMFVAFEDDVGYDGYGDVGGDFSIVETDMDDRNQRNMMVHELLHNVVGEIESDDACEDDPDHLCTDGWLQAYVTYNEDEFLPESIADQIEENGFVA
jgi:hypothetical protein